MAMNFIDRTLTVVVTATLTSAVWIVAGGSLIEFADSDGQRETTRPAEAAPSPSPTAVSPAADAEPSANSTTAAPLAGSALRAAPLAPSPTGTTDASARELIIPVLNVRASDLSDSFADTRAGGAGMHEAIDIMAPEGTSIIAAAPGTIEKLYRSDAGGNAIYVRSTDGRTIYYYAHLQKYAPGLTEGQRIRRGQRLGAVGKTGSASGDTPHLHFAMLRTTADAEWWEPANAINPYPLLTAGPR